AASGLWRHSSGPRGRVGRGGRSAARRRGGGRLLSPLGGELMDPIVTAALIGTAQRSTDDTPTAPEVDTLIAALPEGEAERALLLRAGAWAVYKQAGLIANEALEAAAAALEERLQPCSPAAANLLRLLIGGQNNELLPEMLGRMRAAGLRLPFDLLPVALGIRNNEYRAALAPVLGERGRWLAQFNNVWSWVGQTLADISGSLPDAAETIWQEGTAGQRVEVLRRLRAVDPAKARQWLEPVWRREKAEVRADLLGALEVGLSPDDEPLLEAALDDKAERVRAIASPLLLRLPTSALAGRMRERAEAALTYANGTLDAAPLTAVDKGWARDGLTEKAPSGTGERGFWLGQALERVPPSHWERRFGATPEALLTATAGSKWRITIAESWSKATTRFGETAWAVLLWQFWRQATDKEVKQAQNSRDALLQ